MDEYTNNDIVSSSKRGGGLSYLSYKNKRNNNNLQENSKSNRSGIIKLIDKIGDSDYYRKKEVTSVSASKVFK